MSRFNNRVLALAVGAAVGGLAVAAHESFAAAATPVERGAYLVTVGGCNDCHTPKVFGAAGPEPDVRRVLSGHPADEKIAAVPAGVIGPGRWGAIINNHLTAWAGPWGVSFAANLTPDPTGIGNWTPENFIQTMRSGKHMGVGRPNPAADALVQLRQDVR